MQKTTYQLRLAFADAGRCPEAAHEVVVDIVGIRLWRLIVKERRRAREVRCRLD